MAAGAAAGAVEVLLTMPFEVTKTRMQLGLAHVPKGAPSTMPPPPTPSTVFASMANTVRASGPLGLWYGVKPQMVQVVGKTAIRFSAFERIKAAIPNDAPKPLRALLPGLAAGVLEGALWVAPTERLKLLRQAEVASKTQLHGSMLGSLRIVVENEGVAGLWRGAWPTVLRNALANGTRFAIFGGALESLREAWPAGGSWHAPVAGALTGVMSTILTNPLDVVKTRTQTVAPGAGQAAHMPVRPTILGLVAAEGPSVLVRGLAPRVLKIGLGQAIIFGVYERLVSL